jgi:YidC/Oxa1 family membrane protein insertase
MDKKYLFFGIFALLLASVLMLGEARRAAPSAQSIATSSDGIVSLPTAVREEPPPRPSDLPFILENDYIRVAISPTGGGVRSIALLRYAARCNSADPWIFDDYDSVQDALSLRLLSADGAVSLANVHFDVVESSPRDLLLRGHLADGTVLERSYALSDGSRNWDSYDVRQHIRIGGSGWKNLSISLGSLPSTNGSAGDHLKFVRFDGRRAHFTSLRDFSASHGLFGLGRREAREDIADRERAVWAAIKNHFFTAILTPSSPATGTACTPIEIADGEATRGLGGSVSVPLTQAGNFREADFSYYVGPMEYVRLDRLGRERVMEFGIFGFFGKLLLLALLGIHRIIPNWGWAIVLLTVAVKLLLWPLVSAQVRSSQKMATIQKPLQEIQRRYKENPQKCQAETLKLFKDNGVNPASGCLPLLIQLPIFFGLYSMLRAASELRFAHFLWIGDLSRADTVARIGSFPINILPVLMGITMFIQMRRTPMPSSSPGQRWLVSAMPLICLAFCYNLPAGLVLYWTVQNGVGILQQALIQKKQNLPPKTSPRQPHV